MLIIENVCDMEMLQDVKEISFGEVLTQDWVS